MDNKSKNVLSVIGIIILVIILGISTYVKFMYKPNKTKTTENTNNKVIDTKSLYCTFSGTDENNQNTKIKGEITINFDNKDNPLNQEQVQVYTFATTEDYNNYVDIIKNDTTVKAEYDEESKTVTITQNVDYTKNITTNNFNFSNMTYNAVKTQLLEQNYDCN